MPTTRSSTLMTEGLVDRERLRESLERLRDAGPQGITKAGLSRALGNVSTRTVDRALGLLEKQGARIERTFAGRPRVLHFKLVQGPTWDEHVSSEARLALRLAALSLSQCGTLLWQDKLATIESLASKKMSNRDRRLFEQLQKAVRVHGGVDDPIESPEILEPILRALEDGREIEVDYQSAGANVSGMKRVVPYALTHDLYSGGAFLLVWDPVREKPLHLRLNRISRVKVLKRLGVIARPEILERAATYQIGGWTSDQEPFEVEARITGTHWIQAFKEAPPTLPAFQCIQASDAQTMTVRFSANHEYGVLRWLLQFGDAIDVLSPSWLRERVAEQLRSALAHYKR